MRGLFFNDTATTEIYTLSLHDALPIFPGAVGADDADELALLQVEVRTAQDVHPGQVAGDEVVGAHERALGQSQVRSEEHTSELQSRQYLVCRLLLEKKKNPHHHPHSPS